MNRMWQKRRRSWDEVTKTVTFVFLVSSLRCWLSLSALTRQAATHVGEAYDKALRVASGHQPLRPEFYQQFLRTWVLPQLSHEMTQPTP